jgi:hypothetical protein
MDGMVPTANCRNQTQPETKLTTFEFDGNKQEVLSIEAA